ncbi:MAG: ABC transporter ATP-binding protein [Acetomicrobium sp.]|jgi:ABC-2 type transport system ATP-binding protein|uniref:ABC transporter ATP-binding protein n=1 Tax=Acetomicrobium TaxID=49894 RepID=UPI0016A6E49F|nr:MULTISPECIES: ABC transporter ATP-binding protein [Acetomicrobium]NLI43075.1 ABC transporter ATP-binding protein [Synergistaceae bacterium]MDR9769161.1 ABC transporter ATP-binding protein [Acetomicrobium sp.]HOB10399.1 ABC transporter ATP-binding protein [Acetomicrobium sp.]HPT65408.1 ABC transporter ATP-binding protein [Acetomicrobium sp.]HQA35965.1 ABC transporter ATP-binding protein [Acetomicrobium sp.]
MALVVEVQDLVKDYNGFKAVDGVTFHVAQGEIFGLLGPNGAGKTTTILMLLGMTEPTAGVVRVCGYDPNKEPLEVKRITGYLPENVGFYEDLTAKENLLYLTKLNGIPEDVAIKKIDKVLTTVGLLEVKDKLVGTYSKGMRQRLGLASVLIKEPKLVILDEPTTGIDPEGTEQVLDLIRKMSREMGVSILLSSHLLYQVQQVCDRVGIMFRGKMVAQGSIEEIGRQVLGEREGIMKLTYDYISDEALSKLDGIDGVLEKKIANNSIILKFNEERKLDIVREVVMRGFLPIEVKGREYSLEEIYIRYFREE